MTPLETSNGRGHEQLLAGWPVVARSTVAKCTTNPIRNVVDRLKIPPNPALPVISLGLGIASMGAWLAPARAANGVGWS